MAEILQVLLVRLKSLVSFQLLIQIVNFSFLLLQQLKMQVRYSNKTKSDTYRGGPRQGRSQEGGRGNFKLVMVQSSHRFGLAASSPNLSESNLAGGL